MTGDQIAALRLSNPRAFDAEVARAMGWELRKHFYDSEGWYTPDGIISLLPCYHYDPRADYSVLEHVRTVLWKKANVFDIWLKKVIRNRLRVTGTALDFGKWHLEYEPGDYAAAFLLAQQEPSNG